MYFPTLKLNEIAQMNFELAYFDVTLWHLNKYTTDIFALWSHVTVSIQ